MSSRARSPRWPRLLRRRPKGPDFPGGSRGRSRAFLAAGRLSAGIRLGRQYGFSSGEMLDYIYEDRARGWGPLGRLIDRAYLSSTGWRGIRERRTNLVRTLSAIVLARRAQGLSTRILDVASGPGRYLLDLAAGLGGDDLAIECRDADADALARGRALAARRGLANVTHARHDALDPAALAAIRPRPDVVVVSGLYEILLDENAIRASLRAIGALLPPGGLLVLTGQPHHPQLALIAHLLTHRDGTPWRMRLRPTSTLEGWCREAGLVDLQTHGDTQGLFTITVGRKGRADPGSALRAAHAAGADEAPGAEILGGDGQSLSRSPGCPTSAARCQTSSVSPDLAPGTTHDLRPGAAR